MDEELLHYGVKGMKWGVRRNLRRKSVKAARLKSMSNENDKSIRKLEKSKARAVSKGKSKSAAKKTNEINRLKEQNKVYSSYRKKLTRDLSDKDIRQGERYVRNSNIAGYALPAVSALATLGAGVVYGPLAAAIGTGVTAGIAGGSIGNDTANNVSVGVEAYRNRRYRR